MHINRIIIVTVFLYLNNCQDVFGAKSPKSSSSSRSVEAVESSTFGKRTESRDRGNNRFILNLPTVKDKKFQITTPRPATTPSTRPGPTAATTSSRRSVKKKSVKQSPVARAVAQPKELTPQQQFAQQFPSLAGLVQIELPTIDPPAKSTTKAATTKVPTTKKRTKNFVSHFICPKPEKVPFQWFPLPCDSDKQCTRSMGKNYRCCAINSNSYKSCTKAVIKQVPEQKHLPIFGVPVKCPKVPLAELFWNVQPCETDSDCWPRVCCPDGRKKFCRSPNPEFKEANSPIARQLMQPYKSATSYIQCTAPPSFDLHPKSCNSTLECFPNLCCQEGSKRHCRPPKRSLFSMVANSVSQTLFGN